MNGSCRGGPSLPAASTTSLSEALISSAGASGMSPPTGSVSDARTRSPPVAARPSRSAATSLPAENTPPARNPSSDGTSVPLPGGAASGRAALAAPAWPGVIRLT